MPYHIAPAVIHLSYADDGPGLPEFSEANIPGFFATANGSMTTRGSHHHSML